MQKLFFKSFLVRNTKIAKKLYRNEKSFLLIISVFLLFPGISFSQRTENWPKPQIYHSLVHHSQSGDILLFPGLQKHGWFADTFEIWAYDIELNYWKLISISPDSTYDSPAYDAESDRVVILTRRGETWAYDYQNNLWENMNPTPSPHGRMGHTMEYDAESDRIILFGGFDGFTPAAPFYNDTWAYDYNTNTWDSLIVDTHPADRVFHRSLYNSNRDLFVIWGGRPRQENTDTDIWAFDFNSGAWSTLDYLNGPEKRFQYHRMVYHPSSDRMILYGGLILYGNVQGEMLDDTWSYNFSSGEWLDLDPPKFPPRRSHHAMVYHPGTDKIVMYGGELVSAYSNNVTDELWIYDPTVNEWNQRQHNLSIDETELSSNWMRANDDSITFNVGIPNKFNHQITSKLLIQSADHGYSDSLTLYDDGKHGDRQAGDKIWGAHIKSPNEENEYLITLTLINDDLPEKIVYDNIAYFTTIGPVQMAAQPFVDYFYDDLTKLQYLRLILQNQGTIRSAVNISVKIITNDPRVEKVWSAKVFPDLAAGKIDTSSTRRTHIFKYADGYNPDNTIVNPIQFDVTIYSNNKPFWTDSFTYEKIVTGIVEEQLKNPTKFVLRQNYPNPFNPKTTIAYSIPQSGFVQLKIYNTLGREIQTLVNEFRQAESYSYDFNASRLSNGVYFYQLKVGNRFSETKKMLYIK